MCLCGASCSHWQRFLCDGRFSFQISLNPLLGKSKIKNTDENFTLKIEVVCSCIYPSKILGLDGHGWIPYSRDRGVFLWKGSSAHLEFQVGVVESDQCQELHSQMDLCEWKLLLLLLWRGMLVAREEGGILLQDHRSFGDKVGNY